MIKEGTEARGHRNYLEFGKMKASSGTKKKRIRQIFVIFDLQRNSKRQKLDDLLKKFGVFAWMRRVCAIKDRVEN